MRHFRFLVAGSAASSYGSYLNLIAFNLFVYETTGSALQTGLVMALRLLAGVVGGLAAGALAARFDLKRIMIVSELAQACAMLSLVLLHGFTGEWLLYALVVVTGLGSATTMVALRTATPVIVGADQRVRANGLLAIWRSTAMVAGFASAGVIVSTVGYTAAFLINASTFALAATNLALLPLRTRTGAAGNRNRRGRRGRAAAADAGERPDDAAGDGSGDGSGRDEPAAGESVASDASRTRRHHAVLALLRFSPLVLMLIMIRSVDAFGSSAHTVGLPIQSRELDPANPAVFISTFWATWAVGNIVAQRLTIRYARTHGTPSERAFALGVAVMSAAFILAFLGLPLPIAVAVILLAGMADGFTENTYLSRLQGLPEEQRARVFGLSTTAENAALGTGTIVSAALIEVYGPPAVVGLMHGLAVLAALGFLVFHRRITATSRRSPEGDAAPPSGTAPLGDAAPPDGSPPAGGSTPTDPTGPEDGTTSPRHTPAAHQPTTPARERAPARENTPVQRRATPGGTATTQEGRTPS